MSIEERLELLKLDLEMLELPIPRRKYLLHLLNVAKYNIEKEGIQLKETPDDVQLQIMYAAYLYRKRNSENQAMPRMLRYALNNRLFSQQMGENDVTT